MKWHYWLWIIVFVALGVWTLLPAPSASKPCFLGYYAHCSFTPVGTGICWLLAGLFYWLWKRKVRQTQK